MGLIYSKYFLPDEFTSIFEGGGVHFWAVRFGSVYGHPVYFYFFNIYICTKIYHGMCKYWQLNFFSNVVKYVRPIYGNKEELANTMCCHLHYFGIWIRLLTIFPFMVRCCFVSLSFCSPKCRPRKLYDRTLRI